MQERNSEKVVSLSVKATKVTANVLKSAVKAYLSAQKNKSPKVYKGKQSVKHLGIVKKSAVRKYPKSKIGRYQAA